MSTVNHMDESEGGPVAEDVRRRIVSMLDAGTLRPGDRLGSEREMAEHFSVSRATLRSALVPLSRAGILERRSGRAGGTFIKTVLVERNVAELSGLPNRLKQGGHSTTRSRVLSTALRGATAIEVVDGVLDATPRGPLLRGVVTRRVSLAVDVRPQRGRRDLDDDAALARAQRLQVASGDEPVDGVLAGRSGMEIELEPGEHRVFINRRGGASKSLDVLLHDNETRDLRVGMDERKGPSPWWFVLGGGVLAGVVTWVAGPSTSPSCG